MLVPEEVIQATLLFGRYGQAVPDERLALGRTEQHEATQERRGQQGRAQAKQQAAARPAAGHPHEGCADAEDTADGREK